MHYVYILFSEPFDKFYVGETKEVDNRVNQHNAGLIVSTKPYRPWVLYFHVEKETRSHALLLEKKLKNLSKSRIRLFVKKYNK